MLSLILFLAPLPVSHVPPPGMLADPGAMSSIYHQDACKFPGRAFECAVALVEAGKVAEGVEGLTRAAEARDTRAMRGLGLMLMRGEYVGQDQQAGLGWLYQAARAGDRMSMQALGVAFKKGLGVRADNHLADYWSKRASQRH